MNEPLTVSIKTIANMPQVIVVELTGDFDSTAQNNLQSVETQVQKATENGHFIFDLSRIRFLNSYAIGQLVGWRNALNEKNSKVLVIGADKNVAEIFNILGITSLFELYENLEAAAASLQK